MTWQYNEEYFKGDMEKGRLQSFSDGVIAIIITIMVLELKKPSGDNIAALKPLIPVLTSYVLSFIYIGIYWNAITICFMLLPWLTVKFYGQIFICFSGCR